LTKLKYVGVDNGQRLAKIALRNLGTIFQESKYMIMIARQLVFQSIEHLRYSLEYVWMVPKSLQTSLVMLRAPEVSAVPTTNTSPIATHSVRGYSRSIGIPNLTTSKKCSQRVQNPLKDLQATNSREELCAPSQWLLILDIRLENLQPKQQSLMHVLRIIIDSFRSIVWTSFNVVL
jgi:hypothetical protein